MGARYFVSGGVDNNWGTTGNWSLTSGGAGGQSVPTSADDVFFDANSPNCTVNSSTRSAKTLTCTGYVSALTLSAQLNVFGDVTLSATMTVPGTMFLSITSDPAITLDFKGVELPNLEIVNYGTAATLVSDVTVTTQLRLGTFFNYNAVNGGTIYCRGGMHISSQYQSAGTTTIEMIGTGSLTTSGGSIRHPFVINTAGTITYSAGAHTYDGSSFTYTAGTVVTTGSTMTFSRIVASMALNSGAIEWNNVTFSQQSSTFNLSSNVIVRGLLTIGAATYDLNINGADLLSYGGVTLTGTGSGSFNGTARVILKASQTLTSNLDYRPGPHFVIDAPGGTITLSGTCLFEVQRLKVTAGRVVATAGTWSEAGAIGFSLGRLVQ